MPIEREATSSNYMLKQKQREPYISFSEKYNKLRNIFFLNKINLKNTHSTSSLINKFITKIKITHDIKKDFTEVILFCTGGLIN